MYKIIEKDPYLAHYEGDINMRMERYKEKKKQLLGRGKYLKNFAKNFLNSKNQLYQEKTAGRKL